MSRNCKCGGTYRRTDLMWQWSETYRRLLLNDTDPIYANWKCDKCGQIRRQKKRQPKVKGAA